MSGADDHNLFVAGSNDNDKMSTMENTVKNENFVEEVYSKEVDFNNWDLCFSFEVNEEYSQGFVPVPRTVGVSKIQKNTPVHLSNSGDKIGKSVKENSENKQEMSSVSTGEIVTSKPKTCVRDNDAPVAEANFNEKTQLLMENVEKVEGEGLQSTEEDEAPIQESISVASLPENRIKKKGTIAERYPTKDESNNAPDDNEKLEAIYDKWEPMKYHYYDSMNFSNVYASAPGSVLPLGNTPPVNMELKDIPCKFHNGRDKMCWKKELCPYYHPIYGSKDYDMVNKEKIRRVPISYMYQLNAKDIVAKDSIMEVTMEHIKSPDKFFVSCDADWECFCDTLKKDIPQEKIRRHRLEKMMTEELVGGLKYMTLRYTDYDEFQLVAVRQIENGKMWFSRAVLLQNTADIVDFETGTIKVQLLDTGAKLRVKFKDMCHLPEKYVAIFPPLAFQCSLYGISPISEEWTPDAISYFKKLVRGKRCILQVIKSTNWQQPDGPENLFEKWQPYQVELRIPIVDPVTEKERYKSVAEILAAKFHGVLWSLSPYRPSLKRLISRPALSVFGNTIHSPELLKELQERENMRIQIAQEKPQGDK